MLERCRFRLCWQAHVPTPVLLARPSQSLVSPFRYSNVTSFGVTLAKILCIFWDPQTTRAMQAVFGTSVYTQYRTVSGAKFIIWSINAAFLLAHSLILPSSVTIVLGCCSIHEQDKQARARAGSDTLSELTIISLILYLDRGSLFLRARTCTCTITI